MVSVIRFLTVRISTKQSSKWLRIQSQLQSSSISPKVRQNIGTSKASRITMQAGLSEMILSTISALKILKIWNPKRFRRCSLTMLLKSTRKTKNFFPRKQSVRWSVFTSSRMLIHIGWITSTIWISSRAVSDFVHTVSTILLLSTELKASICLMR